MREECGRGQKVLNTFQASVRVANTVRGLRNTKQVPHYFFKGGDARVLGWGHRSGRNGIYVIGKTYSPGGVSACVATPMRRFTQGLDLTKQ